MTDTTKEHYAFLKFAHRMGLLSDRMYKVQISINFVPLSFIYNIKNKKNKKRAMPKNVEGETFSFSRKNNFFTYSKKLKIMGYFDTNTKIMGYFNTNAKLREHFDIKDNRKTNSN